MQTPGDFTFVHAADLHLDSPLRGVAGKAPVSGRDATLRALARIVDLCLAEKAAFLALAGDLYDAKDRSIRARLFLKQQLERLDAAGIRTFIVHGNHDPLSGDTGALRLPQSVKVFGSSWEEISLGYCRVQGVSYAKEAARENLAKAFHRQGPEFTAALLHSELGTASSDYAPCHLDDLDAAGLDYWALGHVHTRCQKQLPSGGWAVYPGNPQGRHIAELGERGCVVVRVVGGKVQVPRFVAVDVVRWHRIELDLSPWSTLDEIVAGAEAACAQLGEGVDAHAIRLILTGRGPLHAELLRDGVVGLEDAIREGFAARAPRAVLESIQDQTGAELDFERLRRGGLTGTVFEAAEHPAAFAGLWGDPELVRLDRWLRAGGVVSPRDEGQSLIDEAARRVAEALVEGDPP
jgi:exonuclease SbcD